MASRLRLITLQSLCFARNAAYEVTRFSLRSFNSMHVTTFDSYRAGRSTILVPFLLFDCFGFSAGAAPTLSGDDAILFPVPGDVVLGET